MPIGLTNMLSRLFLTTLIVGLSACGVGGGGGGGGDSQDANHPANTDFQVEQDSLDSGDITQVTLSLTDINEDGIIVKFRYPTSLKYVKSSAFLYSGDAEDWRSVTPSTEATSDSNRYLVFFIRRPSDDETNRAIIYFNIKAMSPDAAAFIEVDLDNNDPTVPDSQEFKVSDPNFSSDDRWNIAVAGEPGAATPTPVS